MRKLLLRLLVLITLLSNNFYKDTENKLYQFNFIGQHPISKQALNNTESIINIDLTDANGLCSNNEVVTIDRYETPDFGEYISVTDIFGNHLPFTVSGYYNTYIYDGYDLKVVVTPPFGNEIVKDFILAISEPIKYEEIKINNVVNFDNEFDYIKVDNNSRYSDDGTDWVQKYVDEYILTEYRKVFHHHNTKDMIRYVYSCTEGTRVIINDEMYLSKGITYTSDIRRDSKKVYDGEYKITTCASHTENCMCRWIVELIKLD